MSKRVAVLLHDLRGGGAEIVSLKLAGGLAALGHQVDLVLVRDEGEYRDRVPASVNLVTLNASSVLSSIPSIGRYLKHSTPDAAISALTHVNVAAIIAKQLYRSSTRLLVVEHNQISLNASRRKSLRARLTYWAVPRVYPLADFVAGVSDGVAEDVAEFSGLERNRVRTLYNPVIDGSLDLAFQSPTQHPWFQAGSPPVVLAVGRLHKQKGFDTLIKAFAEVRNSNDCRLVIAGEGPERDNLTSLINKLSLAADVNLTGFVSNPHAFMSRAAVFVLSSRWEGLPTVLIEALHSGIPIVSTDCPSGPKEILNGAEFATMVAVEDVEQLATAIRNSLFKPRRSARAAASKFTIANAAANYASLIL